MSVAGSWIGGFRKGEQKLSTNGYRVLPGLAVPSGKEVPQQDNRNQPHEGNQA